METSVGRDMKSSSIRWMLGCIVVLAFVLRFIGISYGTPQQFVGDEFVQVAVSLKMLDEKALIPNFPSIFYHQPLSAYISLAGIGGYLGYQMGAGQFENLEALRTYYTLNSGELLVVPRFVAALLGALTSVFLYKAARELWGHEAGMLAALFGATDFLRVYVEHTGRVWGYMSFFIALSLWASVKLFKNDSMKNYLRATGAALLAGANLLPGIFTFVPTLISRFSFRNKRLWISVGFLLVGLVVIYMVNPRGLGALLFRFQSFSGSNALEALAHTDISYTVQKPPFVNRFLDTFKTLFTYIPLLVLAGFYGLYRLFRDNRRLFYFFGSFLFTYYLFIGPFFTFGWVARTLVPLSVYISVLAAYGILSFLKQVPSVRRVGLLGLCACVILPSLLMTSSLDSMLLKKDTREQAVAWIEKNIPEESKIITVFLASEEINQSREALETIKRIAPEKLNTKQRLLLESPDNLYPRPYYFVWDIRDIPKDKVAEGFFKEQGFSYYLRTDFGGRSESYYDEAIESEFSSKELLMRFTPFKNGEVNYNADAFGNLHNMTNPPEAFTQIERFGPIVEIYKVTFK